jgi:carbamoyltransferase
MFNLGFFGSHNAALAISFEGKVLEVVELERLIDFKNAAFFFWGKHPNTTELLTEIEKYFRLKYNVEKYDNVIHNSVKDEEFFKIFPANNYQHVLHHQAHAYSALYQSPFKKALIISFDGGSDERFFNVYIGEKQKDLQKIYSGKKDYAISYMMPAHYIKEIKQEDIFIGNLVYAGKIMGLAGFGQVHEEFLQPLLDFYNSNTDDSIVKSQERFLNLFSRFGIKNNSTRFEGTMSHDLAATNQYVFEKLFQEETQGILEQYYDLPVI